MIVYLDLDRTLYQTERTKELWEYLAVLYPHVDTVQAYKDSETFYHYIGEQYYHDMAAHLRAYGLEPEIVYEQLSSSELADGRFEFEGCKELIEGLQEHYDVRIFTFGDEQYQQYKASLCPSLRGVPMITTLRPKADVLMDFEEECWLVDDRPLGFELTNNVSFVQVCLDSTTVLDPEADWPVFYNLGDVKVFFDELMY